MNITIPRFQINSLNVKGLKAATLPISSVLKILILHYYLFAHLKNHHLKKIAMIAPIVMLKFLLMLIIARAKQ